MKLRTAANLLRDARPLAHLIRLCSAAFQLSFLCAAFESGLLDAVRDGPMTLDQIAARFAPNAATRDALRSWLDFGVAAKVLGESSGRYRIRSALAKYIADPKNDSAAAFVEEAVMMDTPAVVRMPSLLKRGELFKLSDQMPEVVARSSRIAEPFIFDALDALLPRRGTFRLLDIGCGSGTYIRHAADRNPELRALGAELQPTVAAFARDNLSKWGVGARATVETGDIRDRTPSAEFDLAMLNNNIYYFPVDERAALIRRVAGFLKPGGTLLITTPCPGRNVFYAVLDLWSAGTEGCGRLPYRDELLAQMRDAGMIDCRARSIIPGGGYYAFTARRV
jgi:SAM-dependent methyltransferase